MVICLLPVVETLLVDVDGLRADPLRQTMAPIAISLVARHAIGRHIEIQGLQRPANTGILFHVRRVPALRTLTRLLRRRPLLQVLVNHLYLHCYLIVTLYIISILLHQLLLRRPKRLFIRCRFSIKLQIVEILMIQEILITISDVLRRISTTDQILLVEITFKLARINKVAIQCILSQSVRNILLSLHLKVTARHRHLAILTTALRMTTRVLLILKLIVIIKIKLACMYHLRIADHVARRVQVQHLGLLDMRRFGIRCILATGLQVP